jgi:hypothetical protein
VTRRERDPARWARRRASLRTWLWARIAWPLLALAWLLSFRGLSERGHHTFAGYGWLFALGLDYGIWLSWEGINRITGWRKLAPIIMFASTVGASLAFQGHRDDPATYVPPVLLVLGVIVARLLRTAIEAKGTAHVLVPLGTTAELASARLAEPGPTMADASEQDAGRAIGPLASVAPNGANHVASVPDRSVAAGRTRPRGRAEPTVADHQAVADALARGELTGRSDVQRAAVMDLTARADDDGIGLTAVAARALLAQVRAGANGDAGRELVATDAD